MAGNTYFCIEDKYICVFTTASVTLSLSFRVFVSPAHHKIIYKVLAIQCMAPQHRTFSLAHTNKIFCCQAEHGSGQPLQMVYVENLNDRSFSLFMMDSFLPFLVWMELTVDWLETVIKPLLPQWLRPAHAFMCPCVKSAHISTKAHLRHTTTAVVYDQIWLGFYAFFFLLLRKAVKMINNANISIFVIKSIRSSVAY